LINIDIRLPLDRFCLQLTFQCQGSSFALLGPSGCGKTSFLETMAGLRRNAQGRIEVQSTLWLHSEKGIFLPPEKRRVGYVPQDAVLFPHLTVRENIRFGMNKKSPSEDIFEEAIEVMEIKAFLKRYPRTLSGGEKQRVAIARALVTKPCLLLLDEPLASLDEKRKERILPYLSYLGRQPNTYLIVVTHQENEARYLVDTIFRMQEGALRGCHQPLSANRTDSERVSMRIFL
jgi:molybdate transport system ATP-binding protein